MKLAGQKLRKLREQLGYTIRDVEAASELIATRRGSDEYILNLSRLSDIETKGVLPNLYRLYSLAAIYQVDIVELLGWYGVEASAIWEESRSLRPPKTHRSNPMNRLQSAQVPTMFDPTFDLRATTNFGRMIAKWGVVPTLFLKDLADSDYTYGYIGTEDFMMYPILMPGSFVQVDESRNKVVDNAWRSEYERPIYFIETREGFFCCWCSVKGNQLLLQSHPLSPVQPRFMKFPQEAEVVGQVVGVAMKFEFQREDPILQNGKRNLPGT